MNIVEGNLIALAEQGEFDVIIHGCNCHRSFGAGIAKSVKYVFPEAYAADLATIKGDKKKLGKYSSAHITRDNLDLIVVNAYTQYYYGRGKRYADYDAIKSVFDLIGKDFSGKKIGYPMIGAGLAGGDWNIISDIIDTSLAGENHTLVKFNK